MRPSDKNGRENCAMSSRAHKHWVAPAPLPPDLFEVPKLSQAVPLGQLIEAPFMAIDTSRIAATKITKHTARIREAIYLFIRATGGATAGEIATECGLNPSTVRPRLLELQGKAK